MAEHKQQASPRHKTRLAFRIGVLNIFIPALIVILLVVTGVYIVHTITDNFSQRMSRQYSIEAAANFLISTNSHFVLAQQLAHSTTISRWVADMENEELRHRALEEIEGYAYYAPDINIRVAFYDSFETYNLFFGFTTEAELSRSYMPEGPGRDWFMDARDSDMPFVINIQRLSGRGEEYQLFVFTNHRMYYEGRFVGVATAGSYFPKVFNTVFHDFDPAIRRGYIIDELGMVRADSAQLLPVFIDGWRNPQDMPEAMENPALAEAINQHLQTMVGGSFQTREADAEAIRLQGDFRYASIAPIIGTNWSIVVLTNDTGLQHMGNLITLIVAFVLIFAAVIIGSYVIRRIALVPLFKLTESTANTSKDMLLFGLERDDEIGDLARTIHQAVSKEQAANSAKRRFLSNISHEIRTPLNAIIGMTGIAVNTDSVEKKDDCIKKIDKASKQLLGIINQILDMSKIEADSFELASHSFSFEQMVNEVCAIFSIHITEKRLTLDVTLDKSIPHMIVSDELRLAQVITNLLSNAVKFTPEGGKIELRAESRDSREGEGGRVLYVEVADNGIGISKEHQANLFAAFVQAESDITRRFGGTGLGLSISKWIIDKMGGSIWVESEPNKGSRFMFEIPAAEGTEPDETTPAAEITGDIPSDLYKGKTILVVDDVEINCEIVNEMLVAVGIQPECAEDGNQALQKFRSAPERYDMILMDIQMPIMDGITATRLIRELGTEKAMNIPIVAMTANVFQEDINYCLEAGMNGHLSKPLDFGQLMAVLNLHLQE